MKPPDNHPLYHLYKYGLNPNSSTHQMDIARFVGHVVQQDVAIAELREANNVLMSALDSLRAANAALVDAVTDLQARPVAAPVPAKRK